MFQDKTIEILNLLYETQEVNSEEPNHEEIKNNKKPNKPNISQQQAIEIAQGLQTGQITQEDIKKAYDSGQLNDQDIQMIQQTIEMNSNIDELSPEQQEEYFKQQIDQLTDNFVRLSLFDKINDLKDKIDNLLSLTTRINNNIYDKINFLKNYLEILASLIYNLDVNLIYQIYLIIELKLIDILKEELGFDSNEFENFFKTFKENTKETQLEPDEIINKIKTGEISKEDLQDLINKGIYTQEEINQILMLANDQK